MNHELIVQFAVSLILTFCFFLADFVFFIELFLACELCSQLLLLLLLLLLLVLVLL